MRKNNLTNNYITCSLRGRTGNMMFEIAHAFAKSLEYNRQLVVPSSESSSGHLEKNLFRKIDFSIKNSNQDPDAKPVEAPFHFVDVRPFDDSPTIFRGFYQSEKYFQKYTEVIKDLYSPPIDFVNRALNDFAFLGNSIVGAINVRRGDYLTMPSYHPVISLDYIYEAIKYIPKCDHILVLSDDIKWCRENIKLDNLIYVENYWDCDGLWLLSLCDHFIISNSTFSWWGAYLSRNENKKVVAPKTWLGPDIKEDTKDVICENWIGIETKYKNGQIYPLV